MRVCRTACAFERARAFCLCFPVAVCAGWLAGCLVCECVRVCIIRECVYSIFDLIRRAATYGVCCLPAWNLLYINCKRCAYFTQRLPDVVVGASHNRYGAQQRRIKQCLCGCCCRCHRSCSFIRTARRILLRLTDQPFGMPNT